MALKPVAGTQTFGLLTRAMYNVGPGARVAAAKDWQTGRSFTVRARDVIQCSLLTLTRYQLLDLSRDRMTSLLDSEGDVREDVQVTDHWYHLLEGPFSQGANITLVMLQVWPGLDEVVFDMLIDLD